MITGKFFFEKKIIVAAIIYFSISAVLLFQFGIKTDGEAEKFIENAHRILQGQELFNGVFGYLYFIYSLLVALFIKLSLNFIFIAILQIALSFFAAVCLYKLLSRVLENRAIAFLFFMAYLVCYPVQKWNFFLYSESVHTSLLVIGIYVFSNWLSERKTSQLLALAVVLLLVLFSRPVGILFFIALLVVLMSWLYRNKKKTQFYILAGVGLVAAVIVLNSPFTAFVNPDSIRRMEIICQVPEANDTVIYREYNSEGLYTAFTVIKNEIGFGKFFMTGLKKLGYFFGMYRGYYSWQHNLMLICFTVFYPFVLIGIFSKRDSSFYYIKLFAVTYLLFTAIGIFFTCDEWSNRFISPAFPFILILASKGFLSVFRTINRAPV